ncbi:MAG: hypothetical protein PUF56_07705 [Lachnospiraceae bacterium]|nr:hypothetical protein [Lachnospiraceae bacterium]
MKKTLAEPMPEEEGNDNKTKNEKNLPNSNPWNSTGINSKNEKTCQIPTLGIQQVSISNSTMNPFDSRTMNSFDLKEIR